MTAGCFDLNKAPPPTECEKCSVDSCNQELFACQNSESCLRRYRCLTKCDIDDIDCRIKCSSKQTGLTQAMIDLDVCQGAKCQDSCDECGGSMFDSRGASCTACMQRDECCSKIAACAQDSACNEVIRGKVSCNDPFCAINDGQPYDGNRSRVYSVERDEVESCLRLCVEECGRGYDFDCLFLYKVPEFADPTSEITTMDFWAKDVWLGSALTSVHVEALFDDGQTESFVIDESKDEPGLFRFSVKGQFTGKMRAVRQDSLPSTFVYSRPLIGYEHWSLPLFSNGIADYVSELTGHSVDLKEHGVIVVNAFDCTHSLAPGIKVSYSAEEFDDEIVKSYTDKLNFDTGATSTTKSGTAVLVNVPPGKGLLTMDLESTGENLSVLSIEVFAGEVTWANLFPKLRF